MRHLSSNFFESPPVERFQSPTAITTRGTAPTRYLPPGHASTIAVNLCAFVFCD